MALRPPTLSAERQALAAAVADAAEYARSRAALTRAGETAARAVREAEEALSVAQAGVEHAKAEAGAFLEAQALGTVTTAPRTIADARRAALGAEDDLAAARSARDALGGRTLAISNADLGIERRLDDARRTVVALEAGPAALRLASEIEQLQRDLLAKGALLEAMVKDGAVALGTEVGGTFGKPIDDVVRLALYRLTRPLTEMLIRGYAGHLAGDHEGAAREWRAATTALRVDATAPLPANRLALS